MKEASTELGNDVSSQLTEMSVKVLPPEIKPLLRYWAAQTGKNEISTWIDQATEDLMTHEWNETKKIKAPPRWSAYNPVRRVLDDQDHLANFMETGAQRTKLRKTRYLPYVTAIFQIRNLLRQPNSDRDFVKDTE
jgi:hypothetical protein